MLNLISYKKQFDSRHDFDSDDLLVLKNKWPSIKLVNIPDAWILPIDDLLLEVNSNNIIEIRQEYGQPIVLGDVDMRAVKSFEKKIYSIDEDLQ